jgi:hypothetical protein
MLKRMKKYIMENYDFAVDNNKIWIIGIPSGEAFFVDRDLFNKIYEKKFLHYSTKYTSCGFFVFKDSDRSSIMKMMNPEFKKDYIIFEKNSFSDIFLKKVKDYVKECEFEIELYVNDNFMGITYGKAYMEIEMFYLVQKPTNTKMNTPKYMVILRYDSREIEKYTIRNDEELFDNIVEELSAYAEKIKFFN